MKTDILYATNKNYLTITLASILSLYENSEKRCGLFGQTNQAIIKNITVDGNITSTKETAAGIAVVSIATTIENCTNYATINTTNENPSYLSDGGITFTNSYSGGIVGRLETDSSVNNCINYGTIRTKKTYAAGIAGFCQGKVNNCVNYGDIYSEGSAAAGIGGFKYDGSETGTIIMNCCNYGNISSTFVTRLCTSSLLPFLRYVNIITSAATSI